MNHVDLALQPTEPSFQSLALGLELLQLLEAWSKPIYLSFRSVEPSL